MAPSTDPVRSHIDRNRKSAGFVPLRGGAAPDSSPGLNAAPAIMGTIAFLVGLFVFSALSRKADPAEEATMRLFGTIFMLAGFGFIVLGVKGVFATLTARRRANVQTEGWLRDHPWSRTGSITGEDAGILSAAASVGIYALFVVPFNTIWINPSIWFRIAVGVLDLLLLVGVFEVIRRIVQRLRAGRLSLEWTSPPFHPGETLVTTFRSSRRIRATGPFQVTLRAIEQRWEGHGEQQSKQSFDLITLSQEVQPSESVTSGTETRIAFDIPSHAPGTTLSRVEPTFWQMDLLAPVAGPDFTATFLVPVYDRGFQGVPAGARPPRRREASVRTTMRTRGPVGGARFGAGVFGLIGLLLLLGAWSMGREAIGFLWTAEEAEGVVLRNERSWTEGDRDSGGSWAYRAVVKYHVDDRPFELTQAIGSGSATYAEGATVRVLYNPSNPHDARIRSFVELFFMTVLFGFVGSACLGAGITIYLVFARG